MSNISRERLSSHSRCGYRYSYGYCHQFSLGIDCFVNRNFQNWNNTWYLLTLFPKIMTQLKGKTSLFAASASCWNFHVRTNLPLTLYVQMTVCVDEQTFPLKKALALLAALFINHFHQLAFIYFLEKIRSWLLGETELCS